MPAVVLVAILLVSGCGAQATRDATAVASAPAASESMAKLDGTDWRFVEVGGLAVPAGVEPGIRFRGGHASGKAGCNTFGAQYRVAADGRVSFSQVLSTKMACLAPAGSMQVERQIFALLPEVARIAWQDRTLIFLDREGKPLARLESARR